MKMYHILVASLVMNAVLTASLIEFKATIAKLKQKPTVVLMMPGIKIDRDLIKFFPQSQPSKIPSKNEKKYNDAEVECLAKNLYHEARGENKEGQIAVAIVTMNRVKSSHYPNTICKVVYQHKQFSWTTHPPKITKWKVYNTMKLIAKKVIAGKAPNKIGNSLFYYAEKVRDPRTGKMIPFAAPYWASTKERVTQIDNHIFYL